MDSDQEEPPNPNQDKRKDKSNRRVRGQTIMKNLTRKRSQGEKINVSYNRHNQGVGINASNLKSYHGVLARNMVPLAISDWHAVPSTTKDKLWEVLVVSNIFYYY